MTKTYLSKLKTFLDYNWNVVQIMVYIIHIEEMIVGKGKYAFYSISSFLLYVFERLFSEGW